MITFASPGLEVKPIPPHVVRLVHEFTKGQRLSKRDPFQTNEYQQYRRFRRRLARLVGPDASPDRRNLALFGDILTRFRAVRGL